MGNCISEKRWQIVVVLLGFHSFVSSYRNGFTFSDATRNVLKNSTQTNKQTVGRES
jgi:hypothetical protein